jgi:homoserine dehydrogenase
MKVEGRRDDARNQGWVDWFGTVGSGAARILQENAKLIEKRMGARIVLKKIVDIDLEQIEE